MKINKLNKSIILLNDYCKKQNIQIKNVFEFAEFIEKNIYKISYSEIIKQIKTHLDVTNVWEDKLILDFIEFLLLQNFYNKIKLKRNLNPYVGLSTNEVIKLNEYKRNKYIDFLLSLEKFDEHNVFIQNLLKIIK